MSEAQLNEEHSEDSVDDTPPEKRKRGHPGWHAGMPSANPAGRPKGSKNKLTLVRLMAEQSVRDRNYEKIQQIADAIIDDALNGDIDCRKLVWNSLMSKGVIDASLDKGGDKIEITINSAAAVAAPKAEVVSTQQPRPLPTEDEDNDEV